MSQADAEFAVIAAGLANATQAIAALSNKVASQEATIAKLEEGQRRLYGLVGAQLEKEAKTDGSASGIVERMKARISGSRSGVAG